MKPVFGYGTALDQANKTANTWQSDFRHSGKSRPKNGVKRRNAAQLIEKMVVDGFKRLTKDFSVSEQTVKGGRGEGS